MTLRKTAKNNAAIVFFIINLRFIAFLLCTPYIAADNLPFPEGKIFPQYYFNNIIIIVYVFFMTRSY